MQLQRPDPIFNMEVDVMRPAFSLEPKYRVTMFTREDWTRGPGTPPVVKGLLWFTCESRMMEGTGTGVYGQSLGRSLSISQGMQATVFQAEVYDILACVYGLQMNAMPEKYINTGSDSQAALKALQAAKQCLHWYKGAKRCSMISLPST